MTNCCYCCGCAFIIIVNIIFFLLGLALTAVGGFILGGQDLLVTLMGQLPIPEGSDTKTIISEILTALTGAGVGILIAGIIILVITLLGMCGSCCKSKCALIAYCVIIGLIFLATLIAVALYFGMKAQFEQQANDAMLKSIQEEYEGDNGKNLASIIWGIMNMFLQCCGATNGNDFYQTTKWNRTFTYDNKDYNLTYPLSCCQSSNPPKPNNADDCLSDPTPSNSNMNIGCFSKIKSEIVKYFDYLVYGIAGVCGFEALLIIITALMIHCLVKDKVGPA